MYLFIGLIIGTLYGRNARAVNEKTARDIKTAWHLFAKTHLAFNLYILADALYERIAKLHSREVVYIHDLMCSCNRRNCLGYTPSINTYWRKIKAIN